MYICINTLCQLSSAKCVVKVLHEECEVWVAMQFVSPMYESVMLIDAISTDTGGWISCKPVKVKDLDVIEIGITELTHKLGFSNRVLEEFKQYNIYDHFTGDSYPVN